MPLAAECLLLFDYDQHHKAMNIIRILSAAVTGTTMMTLFSYLSSELSGKQFREPVILSKLIKRLTVTPEVPEKNNAKGWLLHYAVGLMFSALYDRIWQKTQVRATTASGLILGGVSGLAGAGVWKKTFDLHPNPPQISFKKYYMHLLAAHLVFGAFTALGYRLPSGKVLPSHHRSARFK